MDNCIIRNFDVSDFESVRRIYQEGIDSKNATFQSETKDWDDWNASYHTDCRLVAVHDNEVIGWGAISPVSSRCVYSGVAEVSVYIGEQFKGYGIGQLILAQMINLSESIGVWTLQSGIFPENIASIKIHEKNDFRIVGIRKKIGKMDQHWRDVVLMERRSLKVGV